ncbi:MAG: hypothetical protein FWG73_00565 [Planctomycetaceae bacterium]|nr:hypothetical protein [Planctomycetaceae bacterium]
MDDQTMLEILSVFPTKPDNWVHEVDLVAAGISTNTIWELMHLQLIICSKNLSLQYRLSAHGLEWIRNYLREQRMEDFQKKIMKETTGTGWMTYIGDSGTDSDSGGEGIWVTPI